MNGDYHVVLSRIVDLGVDTRIGRIRHGGEDAQILRSPIRKQRTKPQHYATGV